MKTLLQKVFLFVPRKHFFQACFLAGILFTATIAWSQPTVTTGKSYINISRPNGGTFLPGDILEVRATIAVSGGSSSNYVSNLRYNDTINLAKFDYVTGSLQMLSNEGHVQYQYTDASDADSAHIDISTGRLRFNFGYLAGSANVTTQGNGTTNTGRLWGALRPTFFNSTCIRMYVYRVTIKNTPSIVDIDSTIILSAGNFRYRISGTNYSSNFSPYTIKIAPDYGLCTNSIGANAIVGESGGTFGSGTTQNRAGGTTFVPAPYTFKNFSNNTPNDNYYGVANTTSSDGTVDPNVAYSSGAGSSSRVFTVWDIIGDHTGAADPYQGNAPDTSGGYAVIINASYETNNAFTQTISNLCEESYYEFSAWFRNICRRCGCDSSGKGASQSGYTPSPVNDSSGVRPNLSFQIDGEEYYTSGNIPYTGLWVKKGFVFKTRTGQTSMNVTIRNNAPGGGGNDWAIDDIGVSTCLPNMQYSPSITPTVCSGNSLTIYDTVRSYFNNYTQYKWQRSTDGGTNWTDVSSPGSASPVWNGTAWEFISSYTIPPAQTTTANAGDKYRLVVATTSSNLSDVNCRSTDPTTIVTLDAIDCDPVLDIRFTSFSGNVINNKATINWSTAEETQQLFYDIQRSYDGNNYVTIAAVNNHGNSQNYYSYTDPVNITQKVFYRIKVRTPDNKSSFSRILQLSNGSQKFSFVSVINPFRQSLFFDISSSKAGAANAELIDQFGNPVKRKLLDIREGVTQFTFDNVSSLAAGIYILRVEMAGSFIYTKVLKQN